MSVWDFVNTELVYRVSIAVSPGGIAYPRFTGVGKAVEALSAGDYLAAIGGVAKTLFDAHTLLIAVSDDTPEALSIPVSTMVGRAASGNIVALTPAQIRIIIGADSGYWDAYAIRDKTVSAATPTDGQIMVWRPGSNAIMWEDQGGAVLDRGHGLYREVPVSSDDYILCYCPEETTIKWVGSATWKSGSTGTVTFQLKYRPWNNPWTDGTDILSSSMTAAAVPTGTYTTSFVSSTIPAGNVICLVASAISNTPEKLGVFLDMGAI